ncbi:MAG: DUF2752 domain-containing protein [Phycisphaerae bacterium]|nr:DUF2752 domain-containing protein [Phycisphaerae bacterium]
MNDSLINPPHSDAVIQNDAPGDGARPDSASREQSPRTVRQRLGPILVVSSLRRPIVGRVWAVLIAGACAGTLALAASLRPDPTGFGTHTQFGWSACGFLVQTGYPCPTCGMTTAFADFATGHPIRAFMHQPMGLILAAGTAVVGIVALAAAISGRVLGVNWYRVNPVRVVWAFVVLFIGSWAYLIVIGRVSGTLPAR